MRTLFLAPILAVPLLASSCTVGNDLSSLDSCESGAVVADPAMYRWKVFIGSVKFDQTTPAVDSKLDANTPVQLVWPDGGLLGSSTKTEYLPVAYDGATSTFGVNMGQYLNGNLSFADLTKGGMNATPGTFRLEVWAKDGWSFLFIGADRHRFNCDLHFSPADVVVNRNASFKLTGSTPPTPMVFSDASKNLECFEDGQTTKISVIKSIEVAFSSVLDDTVPGTYTPLRRGVALNDTANACRTDSPYAYDWGVRVESFKVPEDKGIDPVLAVEGSWTKGDGSLQTTRIVTGDPMYGGLNYSPYSVGSTSEVPTDIVFPSPLQFENLLCPDGLACTNELKLNFVSLGGSVGQWTYAGGCSLKLTNDQVVDLVNAAHNNTGAGTVTLIAGQNMVCADGQLGLIPKGASAPNPVTLSFVQLPKTSFGATTLDVPGQAPAGGGKDPNQTNPDPITGAGGAPDGDYDGIPDAQDNCPTVGNSDQRDLDLDGKGDACDDDDDGDGVPDVTDNCPQTPNSAQTNTDGDTNGGDACDPDNDNDGKLNAIDNCPTVANPDQLNHDGDNLGDACDDDDDGDGIPDTMDKCPLLAGTDNADPDHDGLGNPCDLDDDGDGIPDTNEKAGCVLDPSPTCGGGGGGVPTCNHNGTCDTASGETTTTCPADCPTGGGTTCNHNGTCDTAAGETTTTCPADCPAGGGTCNHNGTCDTTAGETTTNCAADCPGGGGGGGDPTDSDGDGIPDSKDNCPTTPNLDQKDSNNNGVGDACETGGGGGGGNGQADSDGDGVSDAWDNCPLVANPDQKDSDANGKGDACDQGAGGGGGGDGGGQVSPGCSASGGGASTWFGLALIGLVAARRRRRGA